MGALFFVRTMMFKRFLNDDVGASLAEYAFLASLISIVAILVITMVGDGVYALFNTAHQMMKQVGM